MAQTAEKKKTPTEEKRFIQAKKRHDDNVAAKSAVKTVFKKALESISAGTADAAAQVKAAVVSIDKAATKRIVHKNKAARKKSRLARKLNALAAKK